jgi:DNA invertase Pin-like site-specific DNA recombinase
MRTEKIQPHHLEKKAYIYIRQSSPQQLQRNQESTELQYKLVQRASALGWATQRIQVIDEDLGKSGQSAENRQGFQKLLAEISLDRVGIIFGIEMSRLARSCTDWYHLLELCGLFRCLLADQDGVYDPTIYNDRLLLGLKGTMSEAELHVLKGRLYAGKLNKAQKAKLFSHAPSGYIRQLNGDVTFDPDEQVQFVTRLVFKKFEELGSVNSVLQYLVKNKVQIGFRDQTIQTKNQLLWRRPNLGTLLYILHNPMYAGAYSFGRRYHDGRLKQKGKPFSGGRRLPLDKWKVLIKDTLPTYITWSQYMENQARLKMNATRFHAKGIPREGRALLRGLLVCMKCDYKLNVMYNGRGFVQYQCSRAYSQNAEKNCISFSGLEIDNFVANEILQVIEPASLQLSIEAEEQIKNKQEEINKNWSLRIERAQIKVERARRQYDQVEPENRLVARHLESEWEQALIEEEAIKQEFEELTRSKSQLTEIDKKNILSLSSSVSKIWKEQTTTQIQRQKIIQLLIEKIIVWQPNQSNLLNFKIHWKGGEITEYELRNRVRAYSKTHDYEKLMRRISELRDQGLTYQAIAETLNRDGFKPAKCAGEFKGFTVSEIVKNARLPKIQDPLALARKLLGPDEWLLADLAERLKIPYQTIYGWKKKKLFETRQITRGKGSFHVVKANQKELKRLREIYESHPQNQKGEPT